MESVQVRKFVGGSQRGMGVFSYIAKTGVFVGLLRYTTRIWNPAETIIWVLVERLFELKNVVKENFSNCHMAVDKTRYVVRCRAKRKLQKHFAAQKRNLEAVAGQQDR